MQKQTKSFRKTKEEVGNNNEINEDGKGKRDYDGEEGEEETERKKRIATTVIRNLMFYSLMKIKCARLLYRSFDL